MTLRTCPWCGESVTEFPATSRIDNKTKVCPDCGEMEALLQYFFRKNSDRYAVIRGVADIMQGTREATKQLEARMIELREK